MKAAALKQIILFCLACLPSVSFVWSPFFHHDSTPLSAAAGSEKEVYVDFSALDDAAMMGLHPLIRYKIDEERTELLSVVGGMVYATKRPMPYEILSNPNFEFQIYICPDEGDPLYRSNWVKAGRKLGESIYNCVIISSLVSEKYLAIDNFGFYGEKSINRGATYATQRIWLCTDFETVKDYSHGLTFGVGYYDHDQWCIVLMESIKNQGDQANYCYADVPEDLLSACILLLPDQTNSSYLIYRDIAISNIAYGVCYCVKDFEDSALSLRIAYGADANLLARVTEAYLTYGESASNGSDGQTIKNLYSTWFANKAATRNDLESVRINDYSGFSANGNSYEGLSKTSKYSVYEKWKALCSRAGIDPNTGKEVNTLWQRLITLFDVGPASILAVILFMTCCFTVFAAVERKRVSK